MASLPPPEGHSVSGHWSPKQIIYWSPRWPQISQQIASSAIIASGILFNIWTRFASLLGLYSAEKFAGWSRRPGRELLMRFCGHLIWKSRVWQLLRSAYVHNCDLSFDVTDLEGRRWLMMFYSSYLVANEFIGLSRDGTREATRQHQQERGRGNTAVWNKFHLTWQNTWVVCPLLDTIWEMSSVRYFRRYTKTCCCAS